MHYFRRFFKKGLKPRVKFSRVWRKTLLFGNFLEIFENFQKFLKKIAKNHYFSLFSNKILKNPALIFRAFGRKIQIVLKFWKNFGIFWLKFNRKFEFLIIFGKVVAQNRAFGNNIIFLQQFFPFRGERSLCPPPPGGACTMQNLNFAESSYFNYGKNCQNGSIQI